jgi:hypothetical protein
MRSDRLLQLFGNRRFADEQRRRLETSSIRRRLWDGCFISWLRDLTRNSNRLHMLANPVTEMVEAAL